MSINNSSNDRLLKKNKNKPNKIIKGFRAVFIVIVFFLMGIAALLASMGTKKASDDERQIATGGYVLESIPQYEGEIYCVLNDNKPMFDTGFTGSLEVYGELDSKGRCTYAFANVCRETMPREERGEIWQVKPSGWKQVKYPGLVDSTPPYLYNRCHLIGYQFTGENDNEKNLITGTRYFNAEGMLPFENTLREYINRTGNHVLYRVTPIFAGDNLVASGVVMEAWSVEDSGKGICFNVFVFNVQPGIEIDYSDGSSHIREES